MIIHLPNAYWANIDLLWVRHYCMFWENKGKLNKVCAVKKLSFHRRFYPKPGSDLCISLNEALLGSQAFNHRALTGSLSFFYLTTHLDVSQNFARIESSLLLTFLTIHNSLPPCLFTSCFIFPHHTLSPCYLLKLYRLFKDQHK